MKEKEEEKERRIARTWTLSPLFTLPTQKGKKLPCLLISIHHIHPLVPPSTQSNQPLLFLTSIPLSVHLIHSNQIPRLSVPCPPSSSPLSSLQHLQTSPKLKTKSPRCFKLNRRVASASGKKNSNSSPLLYIMVDYSSVDKSTVGVLQKLQAWNTSPHRASPPRQTGSSWAEGS